MNTATTPISLETAFCARYLHHVSVHLSSLLSIMWAPKGADSTAKTELHGKCLPFEAVHGHWSIKVIDFELSRKPTFHSVLTGIKCDTTRDLWRNKARIKRCYWFWKENPSLTIYISGIPANTATKIISLQKYTLCHTFAPRQVCVIHLHVVSCQRHLLYRERRKLTGNWGRRSSKVILFLIFGTNWKVVLDFLFMFNSNCGLISKRFTDRASSRLKLTRFSIACRLMMQSLRNFWMTFAI